ncbi:MAG TPA: hypothetical protein VM261_16440 [Kofleriaceae bacterium]|nr:hypothetical protein [Kofleriaceae bacterium]
MTPASPRAFCFAVRRVLPLSGDAMNRFKTPALCFALCASFAATAACRGGGGDDGDDDGSNPDAAGGETTVQEVQNDAMPPGTPVSLRGVVVTAVDNYGPRKGNFYVAEPEGGAYSGVLVYGAALDVVAQLAVGDIVDITDAEKDEFSLDTDDATVTELGPVAGGVMTVTETGTTTPPAPAVIDALAIGRMATAAREAEYEKYEGVLVTVQNISVTSEIRPVSSSEPDPTFVAFRITGVLEVDSSLAEIPYSATNPPAPFVTGGDCLASITGMGDYFFNYKVLPRATSDIMLGGSGCPAAEAPGTCADGIDNDANGFLDCADRGCSAEASCTTDTTVSNIQMGMHPDGTGIRIVDAIVTAVGRGPTNIQNIWVADSLAAGPHNGLQVYRGTMAGQVPAGVVVGAHVTIQGEVDEFNNGSGTDTLTEIRNSTITFVSAPTSAPTAVTGVSVATLTNNTTGEPYEGVLIQLANVRMTGTPSGQTFGVRYFGTAAAPQTVLFDSDDDIGPALTQADGTCFSTIKGIWTWQTFDDRWAILPLSTVDAVVAANQNDCP